MLPETGGLRFGSQGKATGDPMLWLHRLYPVSRRSCIEVLAVDAFGFLVNGNGRPRACAAWIDALERRGVGLGGEYGLVSIRSSG